MSKKQKPENKPNDNTAFSKEDWYGGSRKSRRNKNKKNKTAYKPVNHNRYPAENYKAPAVSDAEIMAALAENSKKPD